MPLVRLGAPRDADGEAGGARPVCPDGRKLTPPDHLAGNVRPWSDMRRFGLAMLTILTRKQPYCECVTPAELSQKLLAHRPPDALAVVREDMAADVVRACFHAPRTRETAAGLLRHLYFDEGQEGGGAAVKSADALQDQGRFVILQSSTAARSLPKLAPKTAAAQPQPELTPAAPP